MKKLILSLLLGVGLVGFIGNLNADMFGSDEDSWSYYTNYSSGVMISSAVPLEVTAVMVGTGTAAQYLIIVDSNTLQATTGGSYPAITNLTWPATQRVLPSIPFVSTITYTTGFDGAPVLKPINFPRTIIRNGLTVIKPSAAGEYTIWYKRIR